MKRSIAIALVAIVVATACSPSASVTAPPVGSPSPTSSAPGASASPLAYSWPGTLAAGTYTTPFTWDTPVTVTFTVPDGWGSRDVEIFKDPVSRVNEVGGPRGLSVVFSLVDNVYADGCAGTLREPAVGPTVDAVADALVGLSGIDSTAPVPVTFDGFAGKYLEFSVAPDAGCELAAFHLWNIRPEWIDQTKPHGGSFFTAERENYRVWVLDVNGVRYLVAGLSASDATPDDLAELQGVIDSIQLDT